jgi:hypothetical protein
MRCSIYTLQSNGVALLGGFFGRALFAKEGVKFEIKLRRLLSYLFFWMTR